MDFKLAVVLWLIGLFIGTGLIYGLIEYLENHRK